MTTKTLLFLVESALPTAMLLTNIFLIRVYLKSYRIDSEKYAWCPYFALSSFAFFGVSFITLIMPFLTSVAPFSPRFALGLLALQFSLGMIGCAALVCGAKKLITITLAQSGDAGG